MGLNKQVIDYDNISIPKIKKSNRIPENQIIEYISSYSGNEFEMFIFEWLKFCKKDLTKNSLLFRIGGAGDKGVDIYYKENDQIVYYQAKQYNRQLLHSDVLEIVTKIFGM